MDVKVYRNEDVRKITAFIPPGHRHVRILLELSDQIIVLQEATVAAIVRAYIDIITHPTRRAVELVSRQVPSSERKQGYAEFQLVESNKTEEEIIREVLERLSS